MGKDMSEKAIEANRRNAEKSTGPRTAAGKAAVRLNRVTHGLASQGPLVPGEDEKAFHQLRARLAEELAPAGVLEEALVDRITSCTWRLWRAERFEAGIFEHRRLDILAERAKKPDEMLQLLEYDRSTPQQQEYKRQQKNDLPTWGLAFIQSCTGKGTLALLSRYEAGIERSLYRALHELERLQRSRAGEALPPPAAVDITVSGADNGFEP